MHQAFVVHFKLPVTPEEPVIADLECGCAAPLLKAIAERLPTRQQYLLNRRLETWRYGSGHDYEL
jgi:hypothetical protein